MLKKKSTVAIIMIAGLVAIAILFNSCSRDKEITAPEQPKDEFASFKAKAQVYQDWIECMEPYVIKNTDGTFSLEWDKFLGSIKVSYPEVARYFQGNGSPSDETKVIEELKNGIPLANEELLKGGAFGKVCDTQGYACWTYWWGRRCCFWGSTAVWAVAVLTAGGSLPVVGWGFNIYAAWAAALTALYNGFCANRSWVGGCWLTAP